MPRTSFAAATNRDEGEHNEYVHEFPSKQNSVRTAGDHYADVGDAAVGIYGDDHSVKGAVSDTVTPPDSNAADGDVAEVTVGNSTMTYGDITNAFDAAKYATESVTVKLLDDIDSFATGFSRAYVVQFQGGDITLVLNGHFLERYNNAAGTIANNRAVFM